jgi:hypothetical protein
MTNNDKSLSVHKYSQNLKIHTIGSCSLHITITSDVYPFLTDVFVFSSLMTSLVSIGQLVDNDSKVKFSKFDCVVHDQQSRKIEIVKGFKVGQFFLSIYLCLHVSHYFLSLVTLFILIAKHDINILDIQTLMYFMIC